MIWVVGARGMLGQDIVRQLDGMGLSYIDSDLECDITDRNAVDRFITNKPIDWIINCSAYTAVEKAEDEEEKAHAVNAIGPENLGRAAAEMDARIIHLSTDYVFDGEATFPYTEEHITAPLGVYGRTKARGEKLLAEATPKHFIVRTAWLYGVRGKNFVYTMLRMMNERSQVSVVDDQRGSPTYTHDLTSAICAIIRADSSAFGIYHYTNKGETTWYQFARSIYEVGRAHGHITHVCEVRPITTDQYPTKTPRPKYAVLSKVKIARTFAIAIPPWQDGLERFFRELDEADSA